MHSEDQQHRARKLFIAIGSTNEGGEQECVRLYTKQANHLLEASTKNNQA